MLRRHILQKLSYIKMRRFIQKMQYKTAVDLHYVNANDMVEVQVICSYR